MNKRLKTKIYSLAFGGDGIGKIDGKVCFVRGAIPDEEVIFEVTKEKPSYMGGFAVEILSPSKDRVAPPCKYYSKCGGCQLQHLLYEKELYYKKEQVAELIKRIAGEYDFEYLGMFPSPAEYGYRSSVTLHRATNGGYGFYERESKDIIVIDDCLLAEDPIRREIKRLKKSSRDEDVTLKSDRSEKVWFSSVKEEKYFPDNYDGVEMLMSTRAFSQVNRLVAEEVARTVRDWTGKGEDTAFFDVYCGVGFFGFLLGSKDVFYTGIDESKEAIDCAKKTAAGLNKKNHKFYRGEAEHLFPGIFPRQKRERNVVLLDPPRSGASKSFLEGLNGLGDIEKLLYLSCDPARFARDAKILTGGGAWGLKKVKSFDMFPRTMHIEILAEFERA